MTTNQGLTANPAPLPAPSTTTAKRLLSHRLWDVQLDRLDNVNLVFVQEVVRDREPPGANVRFRKPYQVKNSQAERKKLIKRR